MKKKRIIVGMSGGVDSSVSAYLLKQQGYEVIGLFMQNWDSYVNNDFLGHVANADKQCSVQKDFGDVQAVAKHLHIKVYKIDFIKQYWKNVFKYTVAEYAKGYTPNPDVLCNKYIKFKEFIKYCKEKFGTDQIAMGHYASTTVINNVKYLTLAKDENKDQTYFLCWINQKQLQSVTFPLGQLLKTEVRAIAKKAHLPVWDKKDSTGICFIGERKFKEFLKNYIKPKIGNIIDIATKKNIGTHEGIMYYTIGQNKNLNLSGKKDKYFVCKKDNKNNILYVTAEKDKEKYLSSTSCILEKFNWINGIAKNNVNVLIRFRHRQTLIPGKLKINADHTITLVYKPTLSVTCGQFAVVYQKNICLGGGIVISYKKS